MSVLLHLPNELVYDIMSNWINYEEDFYMTLLLIDTTVKNNSDLRLLLLNHFNFCKSLKKHLVSRIHFNWDEGYSCDVIEDSCCRSRKIVPVEGVRPIVGLIIYYYLMRDKDIQEAISFVNSCQRVKEIGFCTDKILIGLSHHILAGLTTIDVGNDHTFIQYYAGFEHIKLHCRQLKTFRVFGFREYKNDSLESQVMNDIVVNNPNLQNIRILTNNDIFNVLINGSYNNLERITLLISEVVSISNIFKLINKYPNIIESEINSSFFKFGWQVDKDDNNGITMNDLRVKWTFYQLDDQLLCDVIEYAGDTTTTIKIESMKLLSNCSFKSFQKLDVLYIQRINNINWVETVQYFPMTLNNLRMHGISVSVIVALLKCCRMLIRCYFFDLVDDSDNNPTVVTLLKTSLSEYPDCLQVFTMSFGEQQDGHVKYENGVLIVFNMKHYLNPEKCIQRKKNFWTETLKQISRCEEENEYSDDDSSI